MYSLLPRPWKIAVKTTISSAWGLLGLGGAYAAIFPTEPLIADWGPAIPLVWGIALAVAATMAIYGLLFDRYRWEWVAAWIGGAALAPYVVTVWWLWSVGAHDRFVSAVFLTGFLVCVMSRAVSCAAHAAKLRQDHEESMRVLDAYEEEIDHGSD